jgi:4-hydroxy-tetrahydrodipicolinate synthase
MLVTWQMEKGMSGLVLCGSTGEGSTITQQERQRMFRVAADRAMGRLSLIAGIGANDTATAIEQAKRAADEGADAVLHVTGYYNRPTQKQIVEHYRALGESTPLPIVVYNIPSRTGVTLEVETIRALSEQSKIVGIKDSTGNLSRIARDRAAVARPFSFLSGDDPSSVGYIALGGHGCIAVLGNLFPRAFSEMIRAALQGDFVTARSINDRFVALNEALYVEPNPTGLKYLLGKLGIVKSEVRRPLSEVEEGTRKALDAAIEQIPKSMIDESACFRSMT